MQGGERVSLSFIIIYVFFTDMNYAKRYDKCVVLFCSRNLLVYSIIKCLNNMHYVLKFAAPISKCFRRPCACLWFFFFSGNDMASTDVKSGKSNCLFINIMQHM